MQHDGKALSAPVALPPSASGSSKTARAKDQEVFEGNVSFRNPHYTLKADYALYARPVQTWNIKGSIYTLRRFVDKSQVEVYCDRAIYIETSEEAYLNSGALPVRMKYTGADGRVLNAKSRTAKVENKSGHMYFDGNLALSTENMDMFSGMGMYNNLERTFTMHESTPLAVGTREGYNFAINANKIQFFRDSRDIKFYNNVTGWVKDTGAGVKTALPAIKK